MMVGGCSGAYDSIMTEEVGAEVWICAWWRGFLICKTVWYVYLLDSDGCWDSIEPRYKGLVTKGALYDQAFHVCVIQDNPY